MAGPRNIDSFKNLYNDFSDVYTWQTGTEMISVSKAIAHSALHQLDPKTPMYLQFVNHYPRFFNRTSFARPPFFDVDLHSQVIQLLLAKGTHESQNVLLALMAEVGLKIGFTIGTLQRSGQQIPKSPPPRFIDTVRNIQPIHNTNPPLCKEAPKGMWFACRLSRCNMTYLRKNTLQKHFGQKHKIGATEIFEVLEDPENEELVKRFGPYTPQQLDTVDYDPGTLTESRVPKRKRMLWDRA